MDTSRGPRPRRTTSTGSAPRPSRSVGVAPVRTVSVAAPGSVPRPWVQVPRAIGVGELVLDASAELDATFTAPPQEASLVLEASSVTEAIGGYFESSGVAELTLTASAALEVVADATGEGVLELSASSVSEGTLKLQAMGMDKTGDQAIGTNDGWVKVTSWTARVNSQVVNNELVATTGGATTVTARVTNEGSAAGTNHRIYLELMHNDTVIATSDDVGTDRTLTANVTLAAGSRIWIRADITATFNAARSIRAANTSISWVAP